jgi:hypothetical protein
MSTAGLAYADPETPATSTSVSAPPTESSPPVESPPPTESSPPAESSAVPPEPSSASPKASAESDLAITAVFNQPSYHTGQLIKVDVNIRNTTTQRFDHVHAGGPSDNDTLDYDINYHQQWGPIEGVDGVSIEPGASYHVTISGYQPHAESTTVNLKISAVVEGRFPWTDLTVTAPITTTYSHAGGVVYGDKNNNGKADPGEELANVKLRWYYLKDFNDVLETTTDSSGRFTFAKLPTVVYNTSGTAADGWVVTQKPVTVTADNTTDNLQVRAVRPLDGAVKAALAFTNPSYQAGELAHLTVTLSNTGQTNLAGIVASCSPYFLPFQLTGTGPGWGDLAGDGVALAAGETKTLDVSENLPGAANTWGYVVANCQFGYDRIYDPARNAVAKDSAPITGATGTFTGEVRNFPGGQGTGRRGNPVPGVRLVLVHDGPCPIVGEAVSDANGIFRIPNLVPRPDYQAYLFPQADWTALPANPAIVQVTSFGSKASLEVGPGGPQPAPPTQPGTCEETSPAPTPPPAAGAEPPAPQAKNLAYTGVNVAGMSAVGALALLAGAGVLVASRRRRSTTQS